MDLYTYIYIYTCYQCHAIISLLPMSLVKLSLSCHAIMLSMSLSCYHANAINATNGMLSLLSMSLVRNGGDAALWPFFFLRCASPKRHLVAAFCGCRSLARLHSSVGQGLLVLSCASPKRHLSATVTTTATRLQQQLQLVSPSATTCKPLVRRVFFVDAV